MSPVMTSHELYIGALFLLVSGVSDTNVDSDVQAAAVCAFACVGHTIQRLGRVL